MMMPRVSLLWILVAFALGIALYHQAYPKMQQNMAGMKAKPERTGRANPQSQRNA